MTTFAQRLEQLFADAGVTAYQVAKDCQISSANLYSALKNGRTMSDDVLLSISKYAPIARMGVDFLTLKGWQLQQKTGQDPIAERLAAIEAEMGPLLELLERSPDEALTPEELDLRRKMQKWLERRRQNQQ